jgi:tetratricopeptide (TPR) repeat protein
VEIQRAGSDRWERAATGQILRQGDAIRTGRDGAAALLMADETLLRLNADTHLVMAQVAAGAGWLKLRKIVPAALHSVRSTYRMLRGEIWFRNKNRDASLEIVTPAATMGVRGTEADVRLGADRVVVLTVLEGVVRAWNEAGAVDVGAREQAVARAGEAPRKQLLAAPEDAVQWTLGLPAFLSGRESPLAAAARGELARGMGRLEAGEVAEAERLFLDLTTRQPEVPEAWSLLAVVHLMRGQKAQAVEEAARATELAPGSPDVWVVKGYVQQAAFDLDGAMAATRKALALDGRNVLALTNLARLLFGADRMDEAWEAIETAALAAPDDADVQTVRGFILLAYRNTEAARAAFQRAVELGPSLGEPHMGLGLVSMRQGDSATALEEISTAVLLEPRRSLFLSYWAKMLYQLERFEQARDLLKMAMALDPQDPTPWLYQAIILRDLNRPSEAVESMNRAVALNDNRAVYRSRFLLDRDLATKNVDLSILYSQLGLSAWARNRALASVKEDYTNFAGHLFLAGSLFSLEGRGQAGGNENQLAQLLQPANVNAFNTFNEYTTFFERPSLNGVLTGTLGSQDTMSGDVTVYGAIPQVNMAFAGTASYMDTDGWRRDQFYRFSDVIGKIKWDPSPKDGIMLLASHPNMKQGNIGYEVDRPEDPFIWSRDRFTQIQAGYHRHLGPNSDLLFLYTHVRDKGSLQSHHLFDQAPFTAELLGMSDYRVPRDQAQLQYMFRLGEHQLILGTVQNWGETGVESDLRGYLRLFGFRFPVLRVHEGRDLNTRFQSYYVEDIWKATPWLTVEAALYYDRMNRANASSGMEWLVDEVNPRLGVIITPTPSDTFRLAAFRYLLSHAYRFDPSDVAGVTIFRNALEGSVGEEADLTWEHQWSSGFFSANLFYLERKVDERVAADAGTVIETTRGRVRGFEATLNQILWKGLGLNATYRFMDVDDENALFNNRKDHQVTVGLNYVHPCGLFGGMAQTYRHEDLKVHRADEDIWLTDARIGYIFPGRRGSVDFTVANIFDERFNWIRDLFVFRGRAPARQFLGTVTINF